MHSLPSSSNSGIPPTDVARIGFLKAAASNNAIGVPSERDGMTKISLTSIKDNTSMRGK